MDWLKDLFIKYHMRFLGFALSLVSVNFVTNLLMSASDGVISQLEFNKLSASANSVEMLILLGVMAILRKK